MIVLDIIITHYTEPIEVGMPLLRMIGLQRGVNLDDISVTVVNDGGNRLDSGCLSSLPYSVRQIDIPHSGVSAARNTGLDNTSADWVMFCDFDDTFANIYALRDVLNVLPADGYDMLWTRLLVEDFTGGNNMVYISPETQRFVFVHGKVYRTAFLRETGIRFDETMNFQEDSLFNAVIIAHTSHKRIGEIKTQSPLYVWARRPQSVTNSGREDEAVMGHFIRNLKVTAENKTRGADYYNGMVTRTVYDTYFMMRGAASPGTKRKIIDAFVPWIRDRLDAYGDIPASMLDKVLAISKAEFGVTSPCTHEDVATWLNITINADTKRGA